MSLVVIDNQYGILSRIEQGLLVIPAAGTVYHRFASLPLDELRWIVLNKWLRA